MTHEEKGTWVSLVLTVATYAIYLALLIGAAGGGTLTAVDYPPLMLWTIGASIVGSIVINITVGILSPKNRRVDQRDAQISRLGEFHARWFVVAGALGALVLAMLDADTFWIANVVYLGFTLSAIVSAIIRLVAYRRGFQPW